MSQPAESLPEGTIVLRDPILAAFLAWFVPGLGHLYQGRTAKAILFFVCLMGTYLYGCYLGGNSEVGWARVVYVAWRDDDMRLPYLCQVGIGLPALPALVQATRARNGKPPLWGGFMAPPVPEAGAQWDAEARHSAGQFTLDELSLKLRGFFELGTVYTMVAGLLNLLAIYDAWGGPIFPHADKKEEEDAKQDDEGTQD